MGIFKVWRDSPRKGIPWPSRRVLHSGTYAAALIAAFLLVPPAYRALKDRRSASLAQRAEAALAAGNMSDAVIHARAAYLLRPTQPATLRAAARVSEALGDSSALQFWSALVASGRGTLDDSRFLVTLGIRQHALGKVRPALTSLLLSEPRDPRNLWLLAQFTLAEGHCDQALELARDALFKDPANDEYRFFLATNDYYSPKGPAQSSARASLLEIARQPGMVGLEAAAFLARRMDLPRNEFAALEARLEKDHCSKTAHGLLAFELKMRLHPEERSQLIDAAVLRYDNAPSRELAELAGLLNEMQEFSATLRALPTMRALTDRSLLMLYLDALAGLNRWGDIRAILEEPKLPFTETMIQAFRARTRQKLHDAAGAASAWRDALASAMNAPADLTFLSDYAERNAEYGVAARAYRALALVQSDNLPTYLGWSRLLQLHGTTEELRAVLKMMTERWPEEPALANDLAYLDLLENRNVTASTAVARRLVGSMPELLPFRATLALACLRSGDPSAALGAFHGQEWEWAKALPSSRVVYIAALRANGKAGEASDRLRSMPIDALRPEERALLGIK